MSMIATPKKSKSEEGGLTFALQALLDRHESYMAESEEERRRMAADMARLTDEKESLQAENARVVEENQDLLDQLEGMNMQIVDSDAHIQSLMATLSSAQFENKRLVALASRTAELEAQLTAMEIGQLRLQEELATTQEDERSAMQRWRYAETSLKNLNLQVQRMESEAREEREKQMEILGRMEQRRVVEKELESAAGRLKGAAAASSLGRDKNGTNVVSHFVRDILQDNANLQAGIVELRGLLQTSNEEMETLREQVLQHQPTPNEYALQPASLLDEFQQCRPKAVSQEVHVHHHYHAKVTAKKERGPILRRPPKRRGLVSSSSQSSAGNQTPIFRGAASLTSMPYNGSRINRWSIQSSATDFSNASSHPSSPHSDHRSSSIFDRLDSGFESSRPTSPESADFVSPRFHLPQKRPPSVSNITTLTDVSEDEPSRIDLGSFDPRISIDGRGSTSTMLRDSGSGQGRLPPVAEPAPMAASKSSQAIPHLLISDHDFDGVRRTPDAMTANELHITRPMLRRSNSQESLVSISGMDIHLSQRQNTTLCLLPRPSIAREAPNSLHFSVAAPSPRPLASIAEVHASSSRRASSSKSDQMSSVSLLSDLAAASKSQPQGGKGLGRVVGSWVRGRWGVVPAASTGDLREQVAINDSFLRAPGINQRGPIVGWKPLARTPSEVHAKVVDEGLLKESLVE